MGRQETIGFVLIGLVLIIWMWMNTPPPPEPLTVQPDTTITDPQLPAARERVVPVVPDPEIRQPETDHGRWFSHLTEGTEKIVRIETDLYVLELSTHGAVVRSIAFTEYDLWDGNPVQLVETEKGGDLSVLFTSSDGKLISTRDFYFESEYEHQHTFRLEEEDQEDSLTLTLPVGDDRWIKKTFTIRNGSYDFDVKYEFLGMHDIIANFEYQIVWDHGIKLTEHESVNEAEFASAYAYIGGELEKLDASNFDRDYEATYTGTTDWVGTRNKYFAVALVPREPNAGGAYLEGHRIRQSEKVAKENYSIALRMPFRTRDYESATVTVFLGPMEYSLLKSYDVGLDKMLSLGAAWIIRPISEYFILPLFKLINYVVPNFGFVIIIFSIIIKLLLHPLTKKQMYSMRKMQKLTPMMTEIREKYKEDPQKMNREIMRLYSDYGVNPASGCLPMLPQLPILFALYTVFRSTIELRQAEFALWIKDLSVPDKIVTLPFDIPILGVDYLSGLALLMGITLFIQQKMTIKDPRQKALVYIMPVMLTLLFTIFPSGLNLYYFVFNLLSIGQQYYVNRKHGDEPLRKVDTKKKKGGIFTALDKQMQLSQMKKKIK